LFDGETFAYLPDQRVLERLHLEHLDDFVNVRELVGFGGGAGLTEYGGELERLADGGRGEMLVA
jgi:hypothetical protein